MDVIREEEKKLTSRLLDGMSQINGMKVFGIKDTTSPEIENKLGVVVFNLKGAMPYKIAKELALQSGIGIRYGCHCSHILVKQILHVGPSLKKFQRLIQSLFPKMRFPGVARVSLGIENSNEEVDVLISALTKSPENLMLEIFILPQKIKQLRF